MSELASGRKQAKTLTATRFQGGTMRHVRFSILFALAVSIQPVFAADPDISSLSPSSGPTAGGTLVTINGTDLQFASSVRFGTTEANFSYSTSTGKLQATTPPHAAGAVSVKVTTPSGSDTKTNGFTYVGPTKTLSSIYVSSGPAVVNENSTANYRCTAAYSDASTEDVTANASWSVNGSYASISAGQLKTGEVSSDQSAQITVSYGGKTALANITIKNVLPAPLISSLSPSSGPTAGGTLVTINGTDLQFASSVRFDTTEANFSYSTSTGKLQATTTPHAAGAVSVKVTTPSGSDTKTNGFTYVTPVVAVPVASFVFTPAVPSTTTTVNFTDMSTNAPTSWLWSFGDGTTSTATNPTHTFTLAGTFNVKLTVSNSAGSNSVTYAVTVKISSSVPGANFTFSPAIPKAGQAVAFSDTSTGSPTSWLWNFGDGGTSTAQNPSHNFATVGTFSVSLTVTNLPGSNSTTKQLVVSGTATTTAEFSWSPTYPSPGVDVAFTDKSSGATAWNWNFDDGTTSTIRHPIHRFTTVRDYDVRLTVVTPAGPFSTAHTVSVGTPPKPAITFDPVSPRVGDTITFRGAADVATDTWRWKFDDGAAAATQTTTHAFQVLGDHRVSLTATNRYGELTATVIVPVKDKLNCPGCVTLNGVVYLGGVPLRSAADRVVHITGPAGFVIDLVVDSTGGYKLDVPPGSYSLLAEMRYTATIAGLPDRIKSDPVNLTIGTKDVTKHVFFDPPVIFVHGIRSDESRWSAWAKKLASAHPATIIIGVKYDSKADYTTAAGTVREQLDNVLSSLTSQLPSLRVIAHSKGGLITRALMGEYPQYGVAIEDIVQLGTPNLGVQCYTSGVPSLLAATYILAPDQVRSALSLNENYNRMPRLANIHAIVGTENRAEAPLLDAIYSPCRDSCEANDGFVNWSSATSIEYVVGGSLRTRLVDAVAVPYSHSDLGTSATNWVLDNVVMPYFYGPNRPFPSCSMSSSDCRSQCASGRGLTFRGACTIAPSMSTSLVRIAWATPPIAGAAPLVVTASPAAGPSDCTVDGNVPLGGPDGYRIYRGPAGLVISPAGQPSSELVGYVSAGGREFHDFNASLDSSYVVCAVYSGVNACAQSVIVTPSKKRAAR